MMFKPTVASLLLLLQLLAVQATAAALAPRQSSDPLALRLISFNIRYAAPGGLYERPWRTRGPLVIAQLDAAASTNATAAGAAPLIGLQEVLHEQLVDVQRGLGDAWSYIGTGRDDGDEAGEYCPLLYRPDRLRLLASTQKWLSPTPDEPSLWPGAGSKRYVIAGVFEHVASGRRFLAANTHLDNLSSEARSEGVKIALRVVRGLREEWGGHLPVTLSGDFNSEPGMDAYLAMEEDGMLGDLYALAGEDQRFGPYNTFSGFNPDGEEDGTRLDYLWLGPEAQTTWEIGRYEVLDNLIDDVYISDHRAVVGDLTLSA